MVDEFSSFAPHAAPDGAGRGRQGALPAGALPAAQCQLGDWAYRASLARPGCLPGSCDRRQIGQVLTNILKNAAEAIEGRESGEGATLPPGEISLSLTDDGTTVKVVVEDNGKGLPKEGRERLTEPYMTTRQGHRAGPRHRQEDHGRPWRLSRARRPRGWRCAHQSGIPTRREGNRVGSTARDGRTMIPQTAADSLKSHGPRYSDRR